MTDTTASPNSVNDEKTNHTPDENARPLRIAVLVGSTRPGRKASVVADWVVETARALPAVLAGEASVDLVDLADANLPLLNEPVPAVFGVHEHGHTRAWSQTVAGFDAFLVVTPEYNHSVPAALKNAIDYLYAEWHAAPVGFVGYGLAGGVRATEHLRQVLTEVKAVPTGSQVALSVFEDFAYADPTDPTSPATMAARDHQVADLTGVVDDVLTLGRVLAPLRRTAAAAWIADAGNASTPPEAS